MVTTRSQGEVEAVSSLLCTCSADCVFSPLFLLPGTVNDLAHMCVNKIPRRPICAPHYLFIVLPFVLRTPYALRPTQLQLLPMLMHSLVPLLLAVSRLLIPRFCFHPPPLLVIWRVPPSLRGEHYPLHRASSRSTNSLRGGVVVHIYISDILTSRLFNTTLLLFAEARWTFVRWLRCSGIS